LKHVTTVTEYPKKHCYQIKLFYNGDRGVINVKREPQMRWSDDLWTQTLQT